MVLSAGSRLGIYEIVAPLGAGGMGEVYRARDPKLHRDVAVKILPALSDVDPDRLARFEREAQVLAALNHPNIAAIYGFEDAAEPPALVLELVEGPTLAERIQDGPLPLEDALPIGRQICEALEAAHELGIVHRDLKPANVKVRPDGTVKVLDFGLAKVFDSSQSGSASATTSPTITSPALTRMGVILGTAAYMSPEQAKGQAADKRSDVWAFGCILYEMLTGRRAFDGEDIAETLAAVLRTDPDWSLLPASLPPPVRALLEGCLKRDRRDRVGDISTAKFLIDQRSMPQTRASGATRPAASPWRMVALLAGGIALGGLAVAALRPAAATPPTPEVTRFAFPLPPGQPANVIRQSIAISPDGTTVAYVADDRLYLRRLSELESHAIAGTEQANSPAFSPDSRSLAFWAHAAINRMDVAGGGAVPIYRSGFAPSGLSWDERGILLAQSGTGILRVSPDGGGKAEVLVPLGAADGLAQRPQLLPDGKTLLFTLTNDTGVGSTAERWNNARIVVQSLETGRRTTIVEPGTDARYLPTGHVVYALGTTLFARPFSLATLATTGGPFPVAEPVGRVRGVDSGAAEFGFSNTGSLVYVPGQPGATVQQLFVFDRDANGKPLKLPAGLYSYPRVSPDGRHVAYQTINARGESYIGICDSDGANARQITLQRNSRFPVWSRDSRSIVFQAEGEGGAGIYRQPIDGGVAEQLTKPQPGETHVPEAWSPIEDVLLFNSSSGQTTSLWRLSIPDRTLAPFGGVTSFRLPTDASFSPDGRWVAYQAGEQGLGEGSVYVMPSQPDSRKHRIAAGGRPVWSRDGRELFYLPGPSELRAVRFSTQGGFTFSDPVSLRRGFDLSGPLSPRGFDVLADGGFVGFAAPVQAAAPAGRTEVRVVLNWFEELKNHGGSK